MIDLKLIFLNATQTFLSHRKMSLEETPSIIFILMIYVKKIEFKLNVFIIQQN